ncbi:YhcN/YlaJ family sporulation lipoprotein [Aneurinibacillus migulanus]|uniref:YhcN/YlaJ family sporulation lipoprotein n=1 Tax=Aneurinibacillus migulanus TaxID=47500 RepID=UPI0006B47FA3|nr:YhcN/YlaJ family sporulation lipoprotein [Aneurinibacillus migulanus]
MNKAIKKCTVASLVAIMAGSIAACNPAAAPNNINRTQNYRVNEYQPNAAMPRVHNGIYPYSTPYNGIHPYGTYTPNANIGLHPYGTYTPNANTGLHPYGTASHKQAVADRMVNTAANIQGVTHAIAVVSGRDAVIGLDINKGTKNRAMIEREVANAVKKANPGYNAHVTADRTLHQRIRTLNSQVRSGHPVRALAQDVGTIITDIGRAVTAPFR